MKEKTYAVLFLFMTISFKRNIASIAVLDTA